MLENQLCFNLTGALYDFFKKGGKTIQVKALVSSRLSTFSQIIKLSLPLDNFVVSFTVFWYHGDAQCLDKTCKL